MREILFRGKLNVNKFDKRFGTWVEGKYLFRHDGILCIASDSIQTNEYGIFPDDYVEIIEETLGQFTGLTDKNGTKIFEGDIVRYVEKMGNSWVDLNTGERGSNSWVNDLKTTVEFTPSSLQRLDYYCRCCESVEVIGNIHEGDKDEE